MDLGANFVHDGFTHGKVRECPYYHSEIDENFKSKCPYLRKQADDAEESSENLEKKCDCANCGSGDKKECNCCKVQTSNCDCPLCNSNLKNIRDLEKKHHCPFANSKCPYMDTDHSECPLEKCPYFDKLKKGNIDDMDLSKENCPLKDKCPYYQKFKKDPTGNLDCPMHHGNNEKCPHTHSHKVVRTTGIPTENKVQRIVQFSDEKIEPKSKEVLEQLQEWERELNEL